MNDVRQKKIKCIVVKDLSRFGRNYLEAGYYIETVFPFLGIENQKELIQRYISCKESLQNVPVMDFVDDGYTGSNFDRPGFQQMMDGVRNGKIDTIIVKDLSRFGRDYIGVGEYMEQIFPLLGVRLIAINDNYDSNNYKGTTLGMKSRKIFM